MAYTLAYSFELNLPVYGGDGLCIYKMTFLSDRRLKGFTTNMMADKL